MKRVRVPQSVLGEVFAQFRACGHGKGECVVYLVGPLEAPTDVDEVVHPQHICAPAGYELVDQWITHFWFDLARRQKSVRVQVHTHPGEASHSRTDDEWALIHTPGFLSLVVPDLGLGPVGLDKAYLAERTADGRWRTVAPNACLEVTP